MQNILIKSNQKQFFIVIVIYKNVILYVYKKVKDNFNFLIILYNFWHISLLFFSSQRRMILLLFHNSLPFYLSN